MAKKLFAIAIAVVLLSTVGPVPQAVAAHPVVAVRGFAGIDASGLWYIAERCDNPNANPNSQYAETPVRDGGVLGSHAFGWKYPTTGNEVGLLAKVAGPLSLSIIEGHIRGATGPGATGHAIAVYDPTSANFTGARWVGRSGQFTVTSSGWAGYDAGGTIFGWALYSNGSIIDTYSGTVAQLAGEYGTNGSGAYVGYAMGCNAEQFFFDGLRVGNASNTTTYDFEGAPARARLLWYVNRKNYGFNNVAVGYGSRFFMLADSYDSVTGDFYTGSGTFYEKQYGKSRFVPVSSSRYDETYDLESFAGYRVSPKRETTYWFSTGGSNKYDTSVANKVTVKVAAGVNARVLDGKIQAGQRAVVKGKIKPGNKGTKVSLQRKLGNKWVPVATTKSRGGGAFVIGAVAHEAGTMVLRLAVAKGKGNLGTVTNSVKVKVTPRPQQNTHHDTPPPVVTPSVDAGSTAPPVDYVPVRLIAKQDIKAPSGVAPPPASCATTVVLAPCGPVRAD